MSQNTVTYRYYLGQVITRFALSSVSVHDYLITTAHDEMKRMAELSRETVFLHIMSATQYLQLLEVQRPYELQVTGRVGKLFSTMAGTTIKILLSQWPAEKAAAALNYMEIPRITPHTVTDKEVLLRQLEAVRQDGYAMTTGESSPGVTCTCAPVKSYVLPAAVSIIGPESRLMPHAKEVTRELIRSARLVSEKLAGLFILPRT